MCKIIHAFSKILNKITRSLIMYIISKHQKVCIKLKFITNILSIGQKTSKLKNSLPWNKTRKKSLNYLIFVVSDKNRKKQNNQILSHELFLLWLFRHLINNRTTPTPHLYPSMIFMMRVQMVLTQV